MALPPGVEPRSSASEADILSIELQEPQKKGVGKIKNRVGKVKRLLALQTLLEWMEYPDEGIY